MSLEMNIQRVSREFTKKEWETHKKKHPDADPKDHTITDGKGKEKGEEKKPSKGFMNKLKGLGEKAMATLKALPENTQKFVGDKEFRNKTTKDMASKIKHDTAHFAQHAIDHFKEDIKDVGGALIPPR